MDNLLDKNQYIHASHVDVGEDGESEERPTTWKLKDSPKPQESAVECKDGKQQQKTSVTHFQHELCVHQTR
jgi:hypothetical protein